jgi:NUMOD1 domain/NUMOD4 motif
MPSVPVKQPNRKRYTKYPFNNFSLIHMKGEEWKDIPDMDGYFKASNYGRVWALDRPIRSVTGQFYWMKERMRKQRMATHYNTYTKDYTEQLGVSLRYEGKVYRFNVNRLVYHLFVFPIDLKNDKRLVIHRDGDNCNNRAENLVLMNGTELYSHGLLTIKRRPRSGTVTLTKPKKDLVWNEINYPRAIVQYTLEGKKVAEFESVAEAAKANQTSRNGVRKIAMKELKQLHGFVYRYKGDTYKGEYADFSWEKPVTQYSIEGKKIESYPSVKEAASHTGIDANTISKCALRKFRTGSGYVWRYEGDSYRGELKGKLKNIAKPIIQFALDGKEVNRFDSVSQASLDTGFSAATLLDCARKLTKVSHGHVWRFEGDSYKGEYKNYRTGKPVTQFTLEGEKMQTYPTIEAAAKASGLTPDNIQKNVKGENKTAGGFVWRYATDKEIKVLPPFQRSTYHRDTPAGSEVIQYAIEGKKIGDYPSVSAAAAACDIPAFTIYRALDKPKLTGAGFVWRSKGNRYWGELAKNPSANKAQMITQYSLEGKKLWVFESMKEAEKVTGISSSTISSVTRGKLKTTGGFIWQLGDGKKKINIEEYHASTREHVTSISKSVVKYSLKGESIAEFPSIAEAARAEGVRISIISSAVNNKKKSAVGFIWKLKED